MMESILCTFRQRSRRRTNAMSKQLNETNSVNLAIENELALLKELQMKSEKSRLISLNWPRLKEKHRRSQDPVTTTNELPSIDFINTFKEEGNGIVVFF
ncbi:unnamed protein product [Angiostrongylus costaricensis]|uniref:Uncharacterized protein n=1 Tax=Angiostrongylus costaricensis TaxID=334426 RepID=A0A0R3PT02_ANGCS|nr:unnamed protein product [Angiostrongylus costaricensis]